MDPKFSKRYQDLSEELKELFKELAALQLENERLVRENITLREEVSLLRLYIDTYLQEGQSPSEIRDLELSISRDEGAEAPQEASSLSEEARTFYDSLPASFNFSELFELAEVLGVDKHRMKGYMTTYLRENLMQQHGTRLEKTSEGAGPWQRPMGSARRRNDDS